MLDPMDYETDHDRSMRTGDMSTYSGRATFDFDKWAEVARLVREGELTESVLARWNTCHVAYLAQKHWEDTVQYGEIPMDIPAHCVWDDRTTLKSAIVDSGMSKSSNEAKRLINDNAVSVNGIKQSDALTDLQDGDVLKIGKRRWLQIIRA